MKKFSVIALTLVAVSVLLVSCEEETCKDCRIVTYESGVIVSEGTPETYCGSNLDEVNGETSTVGDMTTVMVCQ
jgi:hypothetical protein